MTLPYYFLALSILFLNHSSKIEMKEKSSSTAKSIRYLALGDSYTIGESVPSDKNYPHLLEKNLKQEGFNVK